MPYLGNAEPQNEFSRYAFSGPTHMQRAEGQIANGMTGTWGIDARIKDVSFLEDLKHTLRVIYIGGTNSPTMAHKIAKDFKNLSGTPYGEGNNGTPQNRYHSWVGENNHYLTTNDSAMEISLSNTYEMYENFTVSMDAAYVALWLDKSNWGRTKDRNGKDDSVYDMWNVNVMFTYSF